MGREDGWDHLYADVGARIARERKAAGMSQNRLAEQIRVTRASIVNIEAGRQRAPLHVLWQIASALEIEVFALIPSRDDAMASKKPLQLDSDVVALIERATADDPRKHRQIADFIQQAKTKLASPPREAP